MLWFSRIPYIYIHARLYEDMWSAIAKKLKRTVTGWSAERWYLRHTARTLDTPILRTMAVQGLSLKWYTKLETFIWLGSAHLRSWSSWGCLALATCHSQGIQGDGLLLLRLQGQLWLGKTNLQPTTILWSYQWRIAQLGTQSDLTRLGEQLDCDLYHNSKHML